MENENKDPYGRESVRSGKYYPVSEYERMPAGYNRDTSRVKATGEFRCPKRGEWFLSGARIQGYFAANDLTAEYHIGELVKGMIMTRWVPLD